MDVSINISGHYDRITRICERNPRVEVVPFANRRDLAAPDMYRCGPDDQRRYNPAASDDLIGHFGNYINKRVQIALCNPPRQCA